MSGDYKLEDSVYVLFTTRAFATGIPGTLSAATVAVYEDVTATPIETSIAVTEDLNSIVGLNAVTIAALAASGYNAGGHYHVVIEAGTVDSVSVVGEVVGNFSIAASAAAQDLANGTDGLGAIKAETALILTDTAEIGAAGAGLTAINLPDQTMNITGNLSGSVGSVTGAVGSVTGAVGSVTGAVGSVAGNVDGNVSGSVASVVGHTAQTGDTFALANGATGFAAIDTVVDAVKVKTDFLPSVTAGGAGGLFIAGTNAATTVTTSFTTTFTGNLTGSVGSVTGAVGSVTGAVGSVAGNVDGNVSGSVASVVGHTAQTGDSFAIVNGASGLVAIDGKVDTAQLDLDTITDTDGVILGAAGVNLIWDEAMTETTGAPAVTGTFRDAIKWMFALSRNKITQTATTTTLRNDADGADLSTSTVSDDATTYTRGEWST